MRVRAQYAKGALGLLLRSGRRSGRTNFCPCIAWLSLPSSVLTCPLDTVSLGPVQFCRPSAQVHRPGCVRPGSSDFAMRTPAPRAPHCAPPPPLPPHNIGRRAEAAAAAEPLAVGTTVDARMARQTRKDLLARPSPPPPPARTFTQPPSFAPTAILCGWRVYAEARPYIYTPPVRTV